MLPVNAPVSSTGNRVSIPFNRETSKQGESRFQSHPEGWTSRVAGKMAKRLSYQAEADGMFTCLIPSSATIKTLGEMWAGGVIATAKAAERRGCAKGRNMPKRQAVIAYVGRGVLCPEPANRVAPTNAEAGQMQSSIGGSALCDCKFDGAGGSARCLHGMNGPDDIRVTDGK